MTSRCFFFFNDTATTEIYTLSLHDALPISRLPSGTLSIDGTSTWTRGTNTYALAVSTDPLLHYNASCAVRPKFDAGTLHVTVTRNGTASNVTIAFTACGQYTVTRS